MNTQKTYMGRTAGYYAAHARANFCEAGVAYCWTVDDMQVMMDGHCMVLADYDGTVAVLETSKRARATMCKIEAEAEMLNIAAIGA